jgi:hypothetical protein
MIVGAGNIASVLNDREGIIFFASGVSNSRCDKEAEFLREKNLLREHYEDGHTHLLVYFSSISCNFVDTPYTRHKLRMEQMVRGWFPNYCILRIGNLAWDTNPNTFVNFIKARKERGLSVSIKDEYRYMLDKETLLFITDNLPLKGKHEITITSTIKKVQDYVG